MFISRETVRATEFKFGALGLWCTVKKLVISVNMEEPHHVTIGIEPSD